MSHLLLADDHDLVRETIAEYLRRAGGLDVYCVGSLTEARTALETLGGTDLVLLDYRMPGMEGLAGLADILALAGSAPVALLSGAAGPAVIRQAIDLGAAGFLPKTLSPQDLVLAVNTLLRGEVYLPDEMSNGRPLGLTRREIDVLKGLAEGLSNKEIARDLGVQEVTVKLHVKTLSRKLNARNRTHAAMLARDEGLV
ncbi:response regulator [Pseudooceanicola sp. C21-150M6]|uniref:response regulator n=1 Tax=Pseudooceanicola sp. C21-150M6 TaxID=3434355 RepID=UPI003D7F694E